MESILNGGLGIGILMFFLLLFKNGKKQGDYFFLGWIIVILGQIEFYIITIYNFELLGIWAIALFGLPLLGAPLLFLYILALTGHSVTCKVIFGHLSIYVVYVLILLGIESCNEADFIAVNGFLHIEENAPAWMQYYAVPLAVSGLLYCIWDLFLLKKHRKNIGSFFSFKEKIDLKWVNYIVFSYFILFLIASFLIFGAIHFQMLPIKNAFALVGISLSIMLVAFGFYGFRQTSIFSNEIIPGASQNDDSEKISYAKSGLNQNKIENLSTALREYMEREKPYLNEDLSLSILAEQCDMNQAQLSQIINQYFKLHFYDYVNKYRIEEVKERLGSSDFSHLSILGIAYDCGFKSKSSFNRHFKKHTGLSPSEFKKTSKN